MSNDKNKDLFDSHFDTERLIIPFLKSHKFFEGDLIQINLLRNKTNYEQTINQLDLCSNVDILHTCTDKGSYGIANRIQWIDLKKWRPFNTFTIRYLRKKRDRNGNKTEYAKIIEAIEQEDIFPKYMLHAYIAEPRREGQLLSLAIAKTKDVYFMIDNGYYYIQNNKFEIQGDENSFLVVNWNRMKNLGLSIYIYDTNHG